MRPEISSLICQLAYPDLVDTPKNLGRLDLHGLWDNIVFVSHTYPGDNIPHLASRKDMSSSSKQNTFEGGRLWSVFAFSDSKDMVRRKLSCWLHTL